MEVVGCLKATSLINATKLSLGVAENYEETNFLLGVQKRSVCPWIMGGVIGNL